MMKRPEGSNADEWQLFLKYWLELECYVSGNASLPDITPFLAVQIAEAIDNALKMRR